MSTPPKSLEQTAAYFQERLPWLDYRTVWRWHFYAGLFSIPFILWLSVTGSIYLFRPQIERWLDRPYDTLIFTGPLASAEAQPDLCPDEER